MDINSLKIGTWNIKNNYELVGSSNNYKVDAIINLLEKENLDVLSLQEVNPILAGKINKKLKKINSEYKITTKYKHFLSPIKNLRVESNIIITKFGIATAGMQQNLPFLYKKDEIIKNFFNLHKRKIVGQVFKTNFEGKKHVIVNNTQLDPISSELRERQLLKVSDYLKQQARLGFEIILTGNLNCKPNDKNMTKFKADLSVIQLKIIENNRNTCIWHNDGMPVDYIAVPRNWDIDSIKTLRDYQEVSSNLPVIAKVIRK